MLRAITILILAFLTSPALAQTQADMIRHACNDFQKVDKQLNAAYSQLRKACKRDTVFLGRLKGAQQAWIKLRDAQTDMLYPLGPNSGTMQPLQRCMYQTDITQKRTEDLKAWIKLAPDFDRTICTGL